ncbi:MAG: sel1 repeat family protein [Holosporales bacterium]|jgi:TPR repeat protein|nr:sel1 repeat family protein [Holosporales bacterium]
MASKNKLIRSALLSIAAVTVTLNAQQEVYLQVRTNLTQQEQHSERLRQEADILRNKIQEKRRICDFAEKDKEQKIMTELYKEAAEVGTFSQKIEIGKLLTTSHIFHGDKEGWNILRKVMNAIAPAIYEIGLAFERKGKTDEASKVFEGCNALGYNLPITAGQMNLGASLGASKVLAGIAAEKAADETSDEDERNEQRNRAMMHYVDAAKEGDIPVKIEAARLLIHGSGGTLWNGTNIEEGLIIMDGVLPLALQVVRHFIRPLRREVARKIVNCCATFGDTYCIWMAIVSRRRVLNRCKMINFFYPAGEDNGFFRASTNELLNHELTNMCRPFLCPELNERLNLPPDEIISLCRAYIDENFHHAHYYLGRALIAGAEFGFSSDAKTGLEHVKIAAKSGSTAAQLYMAKIEENEQKAARLLKLLADQKNMEAMYLYGVRLLDGKGVPSNPTEGYHLLNDSLSCRRGEENAIEVRICKQILYRIGLCLMDGKGTAVDYEAAAELFRVVHTTEASLLYWECLQKKRVITLHDLNIALQDKDKLPQSTILEIERRALNLLELEEANNALLEIIQLKSKERLLPSEVEYKNNLDLLLRHKLETLNILSFIKTIPEVAFFMAQYFDKCIDTSEEIYSLATAERYYSYAINCGIQEAKGLLDGMQPRLDPVRSQIESLRAQTTRSLPERTNGCRVIGQLGDFMHTPVSPRTLPPASILRSIWICK